ncbi:MAG TPA: adenylate/guanylate cyclase domain-containing protein [Casimicrobiaceae bacterium]|nr:adenylate/guanylate cyclase domain-containing protein [Casimicrobiaceae bacterium]
MTSTEDRDVACVDVTPDAAIARRARNRWVTQDAVASATDAIDDCSLRADETNSLATVLSDILRSMIREREQLETTIRGLEAQRPLLGDALVNAAIRPLRERLSALESNHADVYPPQALRQVTILFLDVVGSTRLSHKLDPEETHAIMDGALQRFAVAVTAHGGKILQYAGDSMLAVFGGDEAKEDDADRAVRCGLALLEASREQSAVVSTTYRDADFDVRVGIHTGGVLLGGGVDAEHSIRGDAVNIAARMEQSAPAGGLRISHATYAQVRGVFDVEPQPLEVKGVDEPVVTYLVQRLKPRAFRVRTRGIEGVETRMIGREAELELLQEAFRRVLSEKRCVSVTIVGDAGLGKSRLLYEFDQWAETRPEEFYQFEGRATPQTEKQPYGLLRDIVARRVQIEDGDTLDIAKAKLERELIPLFAPVDGDELAQSQVHVLGHLIGLDYSTSRHVAGILEDGRQIRNRGFLAAARLLRRLSGPDGKPVVLELEDLHWADDPSLDFITYVVEVDADMPLLVVSLTRPMLFERRSQWRTNDPTHQRIDLTPLDKGVSRLLVNELLKKLPEIPQALRELVAGGADGNPFYMEELVRMLVDQGAIDTKAERWTLHTDKLMKVPVPATLTGVLQARLDGLPAAERLALQQASVIGTVYWDQALTAIDAASPQVLPSLVARELAVPRSETALEGAREYAFPHQILHQVTYETLLKRTRKALHAKVADWLAGLSGTRAADLLAVTAAHYEEADDLPKACSFYGRAVEHAQARFANDAVLRYSAIALQMLQRLDQGSHLELRWRLLGARADVLYTSNRHDELREVFEAQTQVADASGNEAWKALALLSALRLFMNQSRYDEAEPLVRRAMQLGEHAGDDLVRLRALQSMAMLQTRRGDLGAAEALVHRGLAECRARGFDELEVIYLNSLAVILALRDDQIETVACNQAMLSSARRRGDLGQEATALLNVGTSFLDQGRLSEAHEHLAEGLRLARALGHQKHEAGTLQGLAEVALLENDDIQALALARSALDVAAKLNHPGREFGALRVLGAAELAVGRYDAAMDAFERAAVAAARISRNMTYDAVAGQARVALARGDPAGALDRIEPIVAHIASGQTLDGAEVPRLILWTCYRVLERNRDPRADAILDVAYSNVQKQAASFPDDGRRQGFIENIAEHRDIVAAWQTRHSMTSRVVSPAT